MDATHPTPETSGLSRYTISFGLALALVSVINGLLVVAKEKSKAVMTGMQRLTGHHWVTHSAVMLLLFALFGWLFSLARGRRGPQLSAGRLLLFLVGGIALGAAIIAGFYEFGD